jgi:hypothetical protein
MRKDYILEVSYVPLVKNWVLRSRPKDQDRNDIKWSARQLSWALDIEYEEFLEGMKRFNGELDQLQLVTFKNEQDGISFIEDFIEPHEIMQVLAK